VTVANMSVGSGHCCVISLWP